ncbi:MAG: hypothetical protein U1G05_05560 [Kiritimatiellia bacterium]
MPSLLRELAASLMTAGAATLLAVWACRLRAGMAGALALAGLAGPLLIGLLFWPGFRDSPVPRSTRRSRCGWPKRWVLLPLVLALRRAGGRGEPDPRRCRWSCWPRGRTGRIGARPGGFPGG